MKDVRKAANIPDLLEPLQVVTQLRVQRAGRQLGEPAVPEVFLPAHSREEIEAEPVLSNTELSDVGTDPSSFTAVISFR